MGNNITLMGNIFVLVSRIPPDPPINRYSVSVSDRFRFSCDAETTLAKVEILKIEIDPRNGRIF